MTCERVLCVDDEPNALEAYRRTMHRRFEIVVAESGRKGLELLRTAGPFPVVVSDYRMPDMNGVQFLARAADASPDSVRIMLTGHADTRTAIDAVNEGEIYRFLTKPCPPVRLSRALDDAVRQYRLVRAERDLLEQTLRGSVQVLVETLGLANPAAFSQSSRVERIVRHLIRAFGLPNGWQYEVAALLSHIGCVTLPSDLVDKVHASDELTLEERELYASHPAAGAQLISRVPRLDAVARMIEAQDTAPPFTEPPLRWAARDPVALGAQLLRVAIGLDRELEVTTPVIVGVDAMRRRPDVFAPPLVEGLASLEPLGARMVARSVDIDGVREGMIFAKDIRTESGLLLIARGHEVTRTVVHRLQRVALRFGVSEPLEVLAHPDAHPEEAQA